MTSFICPSVLAADIANLQSELDKIASADLIHFDVMDNHFVPNLSFGIGIMERVLEISDVPVDAHLMIEDPDRWAPEFARAGASSVTFHAEAVQAPVRLARELRKMDVKASMALRPATPIEPYLDLLAELDMVLIMTVEPGFGGQSFLDIMLPKIERTRAAVDAANLDIRIQVDGGISEATIERAAAAGADTFVAGTGIFRAPDAAEAIQALRRLSS